MSKITDGSGVQMAGPDSPALAAAKARDMDGVADLRTEQQRSTEYLGYQDECRAAGERPLDYATWAERTRCAGLQPAEIRDHVVERAIMTEGSVGRVSPSQAGILPMGGISVSEAMVARGVQAAQKDRGTTLSPRLVRAILEAALRS